MVMLIRLFQIGYTIILPMVFWVVRDWTWLILLTRLPYGIFALFPKYLHLPKTRLPIYPISINTTPPPPTLVMVMESDHYHVVNCIQPHPTLPYLASSGIDYNVKIWAPFQNNDDNEPRFDAEKAQRLMERNAVMLEETKDTITVPAAVMTRMLACIHSFRNRNRNIARIEDVDD
ncbi:hypothetical protein DMENIID0001_158630 [Sergentomyia squamirostris]